MGSCETLDGLGRMSEQHHGSTGLSLERTEKKWKTCANGKDNRAEERPHSKSTLWSRGRLQDQQSTYNGSGRQFVCAELGTIWSHY